MIGTALSLATLTGAVTSESSAQTFIGRQTPTLKSDLMTPEALWAMGRIGSVQANAAGTQAVYAVTYYSVAENKSHSVLYLLDLKTKQSQRLTTSTHSESGAVWIKVGNEEQIAYLSAESGNNQLWVMKSDGSHRRQISHEADDVQDFLFSPDSKRVILVKEVAQHTAIAPKEEDLPKATGMVINDLMYKHWDQYVTSAPHPFLADFDGTKVTVDVDLLEGEPFESPMMPFGGNEQLAWSPDSRQIAYTCRKKVGRDYATSTDSDIFLYDIASKTTRNLCKPEGWTAPSQTDYTRSLQNQPINAKNGQDANVGYDQNPLFSPDGKYIAWSSMERDGYESDRTRLCVYELRTGKKTYVTEDFDSGVDAFLWSPDSKRLYFAGVWHGKVNLHVADLKGKLRQITDDPADYSLVSLLPGEKQLLVKRHSLSRPDEIYTVDVKNGRVAQLTEENKWFYDHLAWGDVKERWTKTVDGKDMLSWVIYPPHFDPAKKYPTLLFCEGGPQSPVSQFWSYRWNFQIMAAQGYIIIAPNRRGLPGFGKEWLEEISGDYTGLCMQDYLSAIDDIATEPYVDRERLGAVGASFGGFSVYWLAGNHNKRFKAFIAHDGIYNTQQQYTETEELWFANWDMGAAPWHKNAEGQQQKAFRTSPHLYVDRWDTPILCIHGQRDFRIEYTQAESAFTAARLRGIPAQLLLFPDENHWVLRPQNGILWQRTFFRWLDKYLK
jgi:prolyl oligopeptidase family protein